MWHFWSVPHLPNFVVGMLMARDMEIVLSPKARLAINIGGDLGFISLVVIPASFFYFYPRQGDPSDPFWVNYFAMFVGESRMLTLIAWLVTGFGWMLCVFALARGRGCLQRILSAHVLSSIARLAFGIVVLHPSVISGVFLHTKREYPHFTGDCMELGKRDCQMGAVQIAACFALVLWLSSHLQDLLDVITNDLRTRMRSSTDTQLV